MVLLALGRKIVYLLPHHLLLLVLVVVVLWPVLSCQKWMSEMPPVVR
jgi:hypothetical protein